MKSIPFKKFIPGIAWFFIVLVLICLPGDDLPEAENWFKLIKGDKLIHVGVFAMLAFLFMYPFAKSLLDKKEKRQYFLRIAIAGIVWGITTELIQKYFVPGRSFDLMDWAADSAGVLLALLFCRKVYLK